MTKVWAAALLSVAALVGAAPTGLQTQTVLDDLRDFAGVLPTDQIGHIAEVYATCDNQVQALIEYVHSDAFVDFVSGLNAIPEITELRNYLADALGVGGAENSSADGSTLSTSAVLRTVATVATSNCDEPITGGLVGYLKDVLSIVPFDQLKGLFILKMKTSPEFRTFIAKLKSPEFKSIIQRLNANPDYQQLKLKARADVIGIISQVEAIAVMYY